MRRYKHSLSHYNLLSCDMGVIVPLTWYEALPADTIQHSTSALIRVSPLLSPVMHPVRVRIHHWFVPYRLIWEDWEDFITGGEDGRNNSIHPHIANANVQSGDLLDYLGVPPGDYSTNGVLWNALPVRAYNLIFNEHYRDQQLVAERPIQQTSGADDQTNLELINCAWEKDYYTTTRPEESLGDSVLLPIGDRAPVRGFGAETGSFVTSGGTYREAGGFDTTYDQSETMKAGTNNFHAQEDPDNPGYPNFYADLSQATGVTVNELREALAIQRYQEARNTYGARYVEYLRYLGVRSSDARLQNPEYVGGGPSNNPVLRSFKNWKRSRRSSWRRAYW